MTDMTHFPTALRQGKIYVFVLAETSSGLCFFLCRRSWKMRHMRHLAGIHASPPAGQKGHHHDPYTALLHKSFEGFIS